MLKKNFDFVVSYKFGLLSGVILLNSSLVPFDETIQVHSSFPQSTVHSQQGGFHAKCFKDVQHSQNASFKFGTIFLLPAYRTSSFR